MRSAEGRIFADGKDDFIYDPKTIYERERASPVPAHLHAKNKISDGQQLYPARKYGTFYP